MNTVPLSHPARHSSSHPLYVAHRRIKRPQPPHLVIGTSKGKRVIEVDTIVRCQADSNYCHIYFVDGTSLLVAKTLKYVQSRLPADKFVRVHQSHLVAISEVCCIERGGIKIKDSTLLPVSRRRAGVITKS